MSLKSEQITVGLTAVRILTANNVNRRVYLHDDSSHPIYLGGSDVTTLNGLEVNKSSQIGLYVPADCELWAVSGNADQSISILYLTD